jgi:hydrogenase maturation factor
MSTWGGRFEVFGREEDWAFYEGDKIIPNHTLIKKSRRKSKKYPMTLDVLEGRMRPRHCESFGTINHTTNQCPQSNMQAGM